MTLRQIAFKAKIAAALKERPVAICHNSKTDKFGMERMLVEDGWRVVAFVHPDGSVTSANAAEKDREYWGGAE